MNKFIAAALFIIALIPLEVEAVSRRIKVTPANIKTQNLLFDVNSDQSVSEQHVLYFIITVRKGRLDFVPFYGASLTISKDNKELVASSEIHGVNEEGSVTYRFSISREYLAESTFTFADYAHSQGRPMPAADFYLFALKAFAKEEDESASSDGK